MGPLGVCSECGRTLKLDIWYSANYLYRVKGKLQCSYTCWDHAKLRYERHKLLSYDKLVKRSEDAMRAQGKTILNPIKIEENNDDYSD